MSGAVAAEQPSLNRERHIRYWLRCLKTFLPNGYTSQDSNRMMLAAFTLISLDLLGAHGKMSSEERIGHVEWIYRCQLQSGGFRAFPGATQDSVWEPASLAGTFFALSCLLALRDDLRGVDRVACFEWLARLQLPDGSFGELLDPNSNPVGGHDLRYCYFAVLTRYIIRGRDDHGSPEIDIQALLRFISLSQTYEGGFGQAPGLEAHAGTTFCAVGSIHLLVDQEDLPRDTLKKLGMLLDQSPTVIPWLLRMQTSKLDEDETSSQAKEDEVLPRTALLSSDNVTLQSETLAETPPELPTAGFCGRCNKAADTCYSFWAGAALHVCPFHLTPSRCILTTIIAPWCRPSDRPHRKSTISARADAAPHWWLWKATWPAARLETLCDIHSSSADG